MRGWRIKFIFLLIVYFAGFATAIYYVAPAPDKQSSESCGKELAFSAVKSDEFVKSFNAGMHKCIDFGREAALRISKILKQKIEERQSQKSEG